MKHKSMFLLLALTVGSLGVAHAQSSDSMSGGDQASSTSSQQVDNRWYVAPMVGGYYNNSDRNTNSRQVYYGLGVGKFITPNASIDIFADRTDRSRDGGGVWTNVTAGVAARLYAGEWGSWRPYAMGGLMGSRHKSALDTGWSPAAQLGVGLSRALGKSAALRLETGYRYDWDDQSIPTNGGYGDWFLGLSLVSKIGAPPAPPAPPPPVKKAPPPPPSCDQLDDDHDNVNNCDDKCPNTPAGTIVGPDGCPQKVVIDLRGVNFKFDRPRKGETNIGPSLKEPTADSLSILDQAVDTLKRYPEVRVMVAGYTDSRGTEAYNQKLSERRAKIVYDYLVAHGIDASRLDGPVGHGENDPIDTNSTDAGRAQNRRTELQVEDQGNGQ
jgi:OmpA-OmpF porin, OOP family